MKRRLTVLLTGVLMSTLLLAGCQESKGLETDEIKITQYKDVEVDVVEKPEEVTDEDVDTYIQSKLYENTVVEEIKDRAVENGDTADIDFVGKIAGKEFEGGSAKGYSLTIGSHSFIDGFEDSVIGHEIGDKYDWKGKFPDDYPNEDCAGKDVVFTITVNGITKSTTPELNDDFVQSVSEKSKTVEEYKEEIKVQLAEEAQTTAKEQLTSEVWEKVLENTEVVKFPEDELKTLVEGTIDQYKSMAEQMNVEYEEYLAKNGVTKEEFEKQIEDMAKEHIKQSMVVKAIAEKEKITLTDEMYEEQATVIAEQYGYEDADALKDAAKEEDIREIALHNLVEEWLTEHCIQKS